MTLTSPQNDPLRCLAEQYCDGTLTADETTALEQRLRGDPRAMDFFVLYMEIHSQIAWDARARNEGNNQNAERGLGTSVPSGTSIAPLIVNDQSFPAPVPHSPFLVHPSLSASLSPLPSFVGGALFSYAIATVVLGTALVIAWAWKLSDHPQVVQQSVPLHSPLSPRPSFVGRITGMVDCEWADPQTEAFNGANVPLGRRYALSSGLMEITYDTGAKVILQGPATYEVESVVGGFLSVGKLTARLEKKGEGGGRKAEEIVAIGNDKSEIINHKSALRLPPSALFFVRTPTATVTDLGTEFGVEVDGATSTETHVFQGKVKLTGRGEGDNQAEQVLLAGQAARLDTKTAAVAVFESSQQRFVRKMPTPALHKLLGQIDYSDTWTANSPTRPGSYLVLKDPDALQVEQCHGNPPRSWVFSAESAMTTCPFDGSPTPWPGYQAPGSKSGFLECNGYDYFGLEYGLRDDFVVQFDAVQTTDRINITIGDVPATIGSAQSLSVFFRAAGVASPVPGVPSPLPEIGIYAHSKPNEAETGLRSGISAPGQWHDYAVRFDLRQRRLTVWVDRECRGTIDLASITQGMAGNGTWADLPWTGRYVTIGGYHQAPYSRTWIDNFRVGSPNEPIPSASVKQ